MGNLWVNLCEKGADLKDAVCRNWPPVEFIQTNGLQDVTRVTANCCLLELQLAKWLIWILLHSPLSVCSSRVFALADPAVFSPRLEAAVRGRLEASGLLRNTAAVQRAAVLRVLQTGLGTSCQSSGLARALEVSTFIKMFRRRWEGHFERSITLDQTDISKKMYIGKMTIKICCIYSWLTEDDAKSCVVFIVNKGHEGLVIMFSTTGAINSIYEDS